LLIQVEQWLKLTATYYVLVLEKEKNGIYYFSQKEVVVDAQYNGYSSLKNAQEFNLKTKFLI